MVEPVLIAVAVFAAGIALGWLLARLGGNQSVVLELRNQIAATQQQNSALQGELRVARELCVAAETRTSEQRALLEDARGALESTFKALASEALQQNNAGFLTLAEQKFQALKEAASGDLDIRKGAIEQLLKPLSESLEQYQTESRSLQERRAKEISAVGEQLRGLAETQNLLQQETAKLVTADSAAWSAALVPAGSSGLRRASPA